MYELTCPSCKLITESSFIRAGAIVRCPQCNHRYRIEPHDFRRRLHSERHDEDAERAMDDTQPLRFDPGGSVVGLSGLSDKMRGEYGADDLALDDTQQMNIAIASLAPETEQKQTGQIRVGDVPTEFRMSSRAGGATKYRALYIALAVMTTFVAVIGVTIIFVTRDTPEYTEHYDIDQNELKLVQGEIMVHANPLESRVKPQSWKFVGTPYRAAPGASRSPIRVIEKKKEQDVQGNWWYEAELTTKQIDVIGYATVHLSLVNIAGTEIASVAFPVSMISSRMPAKIHVPLPVLDDIGELRVAAWVDVDRKFNRGSYLRPSQISLTPSGEGRETRLKIAAYNQSDRTLKYIIFKVIAKDEYGEPIGSWVLLWKQDVPPNQPVKFVSPTPLDDNVKVKSWDVVAAAE